MKNGFFLILSFFMMNISMSQNPEPPLPIVVSGTIERLTDFPSQYVSARNVDIWLPDDYNPERRYAVLYMHDGQMLFDAGTTWNHQEWGVDEVAGQLISDGDIEPCIVVGIWNSDSGRHTDYFPQKPFESLPKSVQDSLLQNAGRGADVKVFNGPIVSDNYLKFLTLELKPYIDAHFATLSDRDHTFVAGSSMGGLISWYALCEYPEVFGGAACISTHWPGTFDTVNNPIPKAFVAYLANHLPDPETHKIYFDYGTHTLDALYEPYQLQADEVMQSKGFDAKNWETRKFPGASHSEASWKERLDIPLIFLLGNR